MKLRLATADDLPAIVMMGRILHQESTFATMDFDVEVVKATIGGLIDKKQFVVVAEDTNGEVIGGMAGSVTQSWFGKDAVANDLSLFVHPGRRGSLVAYRLVESFVQWARMAGAKQIRPGVITGSASAESMYERLGFKRCGATFFMEGV